MKVKPKEVLVNLPVALLFDEPWEIISFAANINTILHGKVKLKVEEIGSLGGRHVGIFYLDRNVEYHQIRDEFVRLIEQEEIVNHGTPVSPVDNLADEYDPNYGDNNDCLCGHPYYRHFDTYDDMAPIGCKYCYKYDDRHIYDHSCPGFKPAVKASISEDEDSVQSVSGTVTANASEKKAPFVPASEKKGQFVPDRPTMEEIRRIRAAGVLINDEGQYCRQVPECDCGCRAAEFGYYPEGFKP